MRPERKKREYFSYISIHKIKANKLNPRRAFDPSGIEELAASFSEYGIIHPIIVFPENSRFVIVCGERRWRAAKKAKLSQVPAIVLPIPPKDEMAISMALIENMHRQNIDVVSESGAIRNLIENYGWSNSKLSQDLGVSLGYVRNRLMLTKFSDVLDSFDNGKISFSEAIELASIEDATSRSWFLQRLANEEFENFSRFSRAVTRHRLIRKAINDGHFLSQPLDGSLVQFEVSGLPYCDQSCKHYLRLTWEEKKRFGLPADRPGWAEYCTSVNNGCYSKKKAEKQRYLSSLSKIKKKRPIPDDGWESMLWFRYQNKMCKNCEYMVDASDFEAIAQNGESGVYAYCVAPKSNCYDKRFNAYVEMGTRREKLRSAVKQKRKKQILKQISKAHSYSRKTLKAYITKRECAYLVLQFLCYAGGKSRLEDFASKHSLDRTMPTKFNAQVTYIRNKLMDTIDENQLLEILFFEAASSAAYSPQEIEPLQFSRNSQRDIPIIAGPNS